MSVSVAEGSSTGAFFIAERAHTLAVDTSAPEDAITVGVAFNAGVGVGVEEICSCTAQSTGIILANVACTEVADGVTAIFVINTFEAAILSRKETEIETIVGVSRSTQTDFNGISHISSQIGGSVNDLRTCVDIFIGNISQPSSVAGIPDRDEGIVFLGSDLEFSDRPEAVGSDLLSSVDAASLGGGGDAGEGSVSGEEVSGGTSGSKVIEVAGGHLSVSSMLEDLDRDVLLGFLTFHSVLAENHSSLDLAQLDLGFLGGSRVGEEVGVQGLLFADTPDGAVHHDAEDSLLLLEGSGELDEFIGFIDESVA
jgi:hypothetical protein